MNINTTHPQSLWVFPGGQMVKNRPVMRETQVRSLSWEGPLEKGMATYSSILAQRIPWTEEPGRLSWDHEESDTTEQLKHTHTHTHRVTVSQRHTQGIASSNLQPRHCSQHNFSQNSTWKVSEKSWTGRGEEKDKRDKCYFLYLCNFWLLKVCE